MIVRQPSFPLRNGPLPDKRGVSLGICAVFAGGRRPRDSVGSRRVVFGNLVRDAKSMSIARPPPQAVRALIPTPTRPSTHLARIRRSLSRANRQQHLERSHAGRSTLSTPIQTNKLFRMVLNGMLVGILVKGGPLPPETVSSSTLPTCAKIDAKNQLPRWVTGANRAVSFCTGIILEIVAKTQGQGGSEHRWSSVPGRLRVKFWLWVTPPGACPLTRRAGKAAC